MSGWNVACCDDCWIRREPTRTPYRLVERRAEKCGWCGQVTTSGIYVRANPATIPYPTVDE